MGLLHRRSYRVLALLLSAVWIVTLVSSDTAVTPAMHCNRSHMPCCPRTGGNGESCSGAQCTEQVPEKSETQAAPARERQVAAAAVRRDTCRAAAAVPVREITAGLRFEAPVFRLKDDFRV